MLHVIDAVSDGKVLRYVDGNKTVVLEKDGYETVLSLTEFGNRKNWLLSGWKANAPDAVSEVGAQSEATQSKPTFSRQELGTDLNNIARNDGMSSRQSVTPKEALRTKRLVDMMRPVVGSFIDQDGEYYAAKLKEAYN